MTKQDEILNVITDTNFSVKQLAESITQLLMYQKTAQTQPVTPPKIGFVQKLANSILDNPKTSLAGLGVAISQGVKLLAPQYAEFCDLAITGLGTTGLAVASDAKPNRVEEKPLEAEQIG